MEKIRNFFVNAWATIKSSKKWQAISIGILVAIIGVIALLVGLSAGGNNKEPAPTRNPYTAYEFTLVYENGDPATDISVQLCTIDETTGELGMCYMPVAADANGKLTYNPNGFPGAGVYEIHLLDSAMQAVEFEGETLTKAEYAAFTLTIKA